FFTHEQLLIVFGNPVRIVGWRTAAYTYCVHLGDMLCNGQERWYRPKRLSLEIHIKTSYDYPYSRICQFRAYFGQFLIKKLCFVNTNHFCNATQQKDGRRMVYRRGRDAVAVVRCDIRIVVPRIHRRLENLHWKLGEL